MRLIGLIASFVGFLLLMMATQTKESPIFQLAIVFGLPLTFFGLKFLVS